MKCYRLQLSEYVCCLIDALIGNCPNCVKAERINKRFEDCDFSERERQMLDEFLDSKIKTGT